MGRPACPLWVALIQWAGIPEWKGKHLSTNIHHTLFPDCGFNVTKHLFHCYAFPVIMNNIPWNFKPKMNCLFYKLLYWMMCYSNKTINSMEQLKSVKKLKKGTKAKPTEHSHSFITTHFRERHRTSSKCMPESIPWMPVLASGPAQKELLIQ